MRQDHRGGEKLFVDYAEGLSLTDPKTGEAVPTELFVAVWGASNYTYVEATLTQEGGKGDANLFDGFTNPIYVWFSDWRRTLGSMTPGDNLPEFVV